MDSSSYSLSASPTSVNANFNTTSNNTWHSNTIYYPYNHGSGCCQCCKIMWHTLFPKIKSHLVYCWRRGGGSHSGSYGTYRTTCTCLKKYHIIGHTVATKKGPLWGLSTPSFAPISYWGLKRIWKRTQGHLCSPIDGDMVRLVYTHYKVQ